MTASPDATAAQRPIVVAIDGPGSSGKSSVGAAAAQRLGYRYFDTGLLYRAVTWLALRRGIPDSDIAGLVTLVSEVRLEPDERGRLSRVLVDGAEVGGELHGPDVDQRVSAVSGIAEVRAALVERQRSMAAGGGIVMAGRDIGTIILPNAQLKLYLDASVEERARRRAADRGLTAGDPAGAQLLGELRRRDELDRTRPVAPLRPAADARILDTDGRSLEETVEIVVGAIRAAEVAQGPGDPAPPTDPTPPTEPAAPAPDAAAGARRPRAFSKVRSGRPIPVTPLEGHLSLLIRVCSLLGRTMIRAVTRVRIEGDLSRIPRTGPLIVIANHTSNADALTVGAFLPVRMGRRFNWLGKREVLDIPISGWVLRHGGIHGVERTAVDVEAFRIAQRILAAGHILAVFPEGTRSRDGALQEVKDGIALLAQRGGITIVPVGVIDADRVWPRGQKLPRPGGRIIVRVGEPFKLTADATARGAARRQAKGAATRLMMGRVAALLPPRQRGVYADAVPGVPAHEPQPAGSAAAPAAAPAPASSGATPPGSPTGR